MDAQTKRLLQQKTIAAIKSQNSFDSDRMLRPTSLLAVAGAIVGSSMVFRHPGHPNQKVHAGKRGKGEISGGKVPPDQRVWQGKRQPAGQKLSKLQTGEIGEKMTMKALSDHVGVPFETLNVGINNAPIDVVGDHRAIEVKTGLTTNSSTAQRWRATIGEPGKAEKVLLKKMPPTEKRAHNDRKRQAILERKSSMLSELSKEAGVPIRGQMVGVIMTPDGKRGDVFLVDGFHLAQSWKQAATEANYIGTYEVQP